MSDVKQRPIKATADATDWLVVQSDDAGLGDEKRVRVSAVGGNGVNMPSATRIAYLGDSVLSYDDEYNDASSQNLAYCKGIIHYACQIAGINPTLLDFAVAGYTTTDVINNTLTPCISAKPDAVVLQIGSNNSVSVSASQTVSELTTIINALKAAGIYTLAIAVLPRVSGLTTSAQAYVLTAVNETLAAFYTANPSAGRFYDAYSFVMDRTYTNTTPPIIPTFLSTYSSDGTHPTNVGSFVIGSLMAPVLAQICQQYQLVSSISDSKEFNSTSNVINVNPLLIGSGSSPGAGCSGIIPRGWSTLCTGNVTADFQPGQANTKAGNKTIITVSATGAGEVYLYQTGLSATGLGSKLIEAGAIITPVTPKTLVAPKVGWFDGTKQTYVNWNPGGSLYSLTESAGKQLLCVTNPRTPVSGAAALQLYCRLEFGGAFSDTAVIEVERLGLRVVG